MSVFLYTCKCCNILEYNIWSFRALTFWRCPSAVCVWQRGSIACHRRHHSTTSYSAVELPSLVGRGQEWGLPTASPRSRGKTLYSRSLTHTHTQTTDTHTQIQGGVILCLHVKWDMCVLRMEVHSDFLYSHAAAHKTLHKIWWEL